MQVNASSMAAHQNWMNNNANNVANINTDNFNSISTTIQNPTKGSIQAVSSTSDTGTDLARELTEQIPIEGGFSAQVAAIQTQEEMIGTLLDMSV